GDRTQEQVGADLDRLGYRVRAFRYEPKPDGVHLRLEVELVRVVRNVVVYGNWPYFEDEIVRHLTLRSGMPLPADDEVQARLAEEAEHVRQFLERDGYFGSRVTIVALRAFDGLHRRHDEWADLKVQIQLGKWYPVGAVKGEGNHAISNEDLYDIFHHRF